MPPLPVKLIVLPAQAVVEDAVAVIVGLGLTFKFKVRVLVHPKEFVAVTEYCVVTVGVTTTVFPVKAPGFQV